MVVVRITRSFSHATRHVHSQRFQSHSLLRTVWPSQDGVGYLLSCHNRPHLTILHKFVHTNSTETESNFNLAKDVVRLHAQTKPDKTCLLFTDGAGYRQEISYKELFEECLQLATGLSLKNYPESGSSVSRAPKLALVILPKISPWWVFNVAASWCGTIISPGSSLLTERDIQHRLERSEADCVVCGVSVVANVDRAQLALGGKRLLKVVVGSTPDADLGADWVRYEELLSLGSSVSSMPCHTNAPDDICQLFFTSGTTGIPKMVPQTHLSFGEGHKITARTWLDLHDDDVIWNVSDTGWAKAAWSSLYLPFIAGATAFVHQMERFDGVALLEALQTEAVTVLCAPPTAYRTLVQLPLENYSFRSLRHCVSAGEPLNPEVMNTWTSKTGLRICEGYGQSESTLMCATMPGMILKPGSMGKPAPGYDVKVIDEHLQELPEGQEGQIAVKTKPCHPVGLFKGYYKDDEKTQTVFKDGYYLTGDRGYFDSDGYLWFVGRADDVIISSGYRIGPFEVESALLEHPSVLETGVVALKDSERGHIVKAFVILTNEAASATQSKAAEAKLILELQNHVKSTTAPYKYPRKIQFVSALPKTVSGKIRRVELRQQD